MYSRLGESCLHCVRDSVAPKIALQLIIGQNALFAFPGNGDGIGELGGLEVEVEVGPRPVTHRSRPELPTPILLCIPRTPAAAPEYLSRSLALVQWVFIRCFLHFHNHFRCSLVFA